jgi:tetratricopeptide (TPR) repeat protein
MILLLTIAVVIIHPDSLQYHAQAGKAAFNKNKWSAAGKHFDQILKRDANNWEAHYYRAICYRETGKFKRFIQAATGILLATDWEKSERHFERIIAQDSTYQDALYQFALLQRYRGKYKEAIQLGHAQVRLRPDLAEPQVGLYRLYQHYLKHHKTPEALGWLEKQPWDEARYFIAEKFRRENQLAAADSILQMMLAKNLTMRRQAIFLTLVRLHVARQEFAPSEKYYWQAVDEISNRLAADLIFEELKYIITNEELENYRALNSPAEHIAFFYAFWAKRNPTPAAPDNVRLIEHYRRLLYVEENYEFEGFKTLANNPDKLKELDFPQSYFLNDEFNDKGVIYLRFGPPNERLVKVSDEGFGSLPPSNESWMYRQTGQTAQLVFHFVYDESMSGNLWRLTPMLYHPAIWLDRSAWDPSYYRLLNSRNAGESYGIIEALKEKNQQAVKTGLALDRHSWDEKIKPLEFYYYTATFRGEDGKTALEFYYGLPMKAFAQNLPDTTNRVALENGFSIHDWKWRAVDKQLVKTQTPLDRKKANVKELYCDFFTAAVAPDSYRVAFHARPEQTDLLADLSGVKVNVPDYSPLVLALSDVVLAFNVTPTANADKFSRNGLQVYPNPSRNFPLTKPLYIYFEVYHLTRDVEGKTKFTIEYTMSREQKKRAFGLLGGGRKPAITSRLERQGNAAFSPEYLAIDASRLEKGEYRLAVKVIDAASKRTSVKENWLTLY